MYNDTVRIEKLECLEAINGFKNMIKLINEHAHLPCREAAMLSYLLFRQISAMGNHSHVFK